MRPDDTPRVMALAAEDEGWRVGSAIVLAALVLASLLRALVLWPIYLLARRPRQEQ